MSSARAKFFLTIYHKSTISLTLTPKWRKKIQQEVREKEEKVWRISAKSHVGKGCKWCKEQLKRCRREQLGNKSRKAAETKLAVGGPDGRKGKWEQKWEPGVCVWSLSGGWGACSEELRQEGSQWRQIMSGDIVYVGKKDYFRGSIGHRVLMDCKTYNQLEAAVVILQETT